MLCLVDYPAVPRRWARPDPRRGEVVFDAGGVAVICADVLIRSVARSLSLAALAGVLLLAGGCVGHKYVYETLYGPTGEPQKHTDPLVVPEVDPAAAGDAELAYAPAGVQANFRTEHPDAVVTRVAATSSTDGLKVYRITYLEGGAAHQDVYGSGGKSLDEPEVVILPTDRDTYRPTTRPTFPTTAPATRDLQ
jgi:hypothetical protein